MQRKRKRNREAQPVIHVSVKMDPESFLHLKTGAAKWAQGNKSEFLRILTLHSDRIMQAIAEECELEAS